MRKAILACACLCLFGSYNAYSQFSDAPALQHYFNFSSEDTNKIILDFYNQNFIKNSEYFSPMVHGMTLLGDDINAQVGWIPDKHVLLLGGIYVRKDFGNPDFTIVQPTWTLKLQNNKGLSVLIGNLEGCQDHRYIEPMYECLFPNTYYYEKVQNPLETGIQLKVDKPWLWLDAWINWAHQEYLGSPYHEHIRQGMSAALTIFRSSDNKMNITVPVQYTLFHFGGQIDSSQAPYVTIFNGAAGLCFNWNFSKNNSFISQLKWENYYCGFKDISNTAGDIHTYPYTQGNGLYFDLYLKSKYGFGLMASYWSGTGWVDPLGGDLYQSVSWVYRYLNMDRNIAMINMFYQKQLFPNLYVDLRIQPYYDLKQNIYEYAYFIFLTYKRTFTLTKVHLPKFDDGTYAK